MCKNNVMTFFLGSLAIGLAACGNPEENRSLESSIPDTPTTMSDHDTMDDGDHIVSYKMNGVGYATGTIRSVGGQSDFLTIAHGPFAGGIKMGAMTMSFDIIGDVDLSDFSDGDEVAFMVKQGRDGSYRITNICNTGIDGTDCLDEALTK